MQHHLHWPAQCSADDADESWLRTRSSIQIHRPLVPMGRSRINSAIYISSDCHHPSGSGSAQAAGGSMGSTLAASLFASGLARPWARRARSAENIPLHAAQHAASDDQDDGDEETPADKRRRKRRRGHYEMPVLSVSGPSPPGDPEELEQHL